MEKNIGSSDRLIRFILGGVLIGLVISGTVTGTWSIATLVVVGVLVLTGIIRTCPLYLPFGIRTNRFRKKA